LDHVLRETDPHLIHVQHLMGLPVAALIGASARRRPAQPALPLVVTLHDYWWVCANAQLFTDYSARVCAGPKWWFNCARCALARQAYPRQAGYLKLLTPVVMPLFAWRAALLQRLKSQVAAWIAPTHFVASWHVAHGFPAERMHVIEHGLPWPTAGLDHIREHTKQPAPNFVYIGGLAHQKGVHLLIDAFNGLPEAARLTIAGDESAFPHYSADLRQRAAHPGIRFVGRLDRPAVWRTLAAADSLVVPSLWYETSSLVIQEALAAGVPVIAADHGALAERVRHEVDGLLVPPGDVTALRQALIRAMDEPELLAQLRRGAQRRPVRSMAQHIQDIDQVYRSLVPSR
jgi:glycosyltransferase involved in cell wall biosynthesis